MAGKRINDRQTLSEQARDLGIDPRGMNASEKKEAIKDKKEENEVKKQAEDAMGQFVREQLALDRAVTARPPSAPEMPTVTVAPVVESSVQMTNKTEPVRSSVGGTDGLPELPGDGTYILGCVDGEVQWLATSECEEEVSPP